MSREKVVFLIGIHCFFAFIQAVLEPVSVDQKVTSKQSVCSSQAVVPYAKKIKALKLAPKIKQDLMLAWGSMYAGYLARNAATSKIAQDWQALKDNSFINNPFCDYTPLHQEPDKIQQFDLCLDRPAKDVQANIGNCQTNFDNAYASLSLDYLGMMQDFVSPTKFKLLKKDPSGLKHRYATFHLYRTLQRLRSVSKIFQDKFQPNTSFTGDVRDLGIIVNLQNNSHTPFLVTQNSTDGKEVQEIGFVEHGMNALNLHTASLQNQVNGDPAAAQSRYTFNFYPLDPMNNKPLSNQPLITVGMYTGQQLINLLQRLPHDKSDIFEMNGRPTGIQHIANVDDWYMVLTQSLTPSDAIERNPDQRIQAVNISKLDGPYLMTMQINKNLIKIVNKKTKKESEVEMYQPSIVTAQVIQPPASNQTALPLVILPQYLWNIKSLQTYWMMHATAYIGATTDFKFFGPKTFGNAFEYFNQLGYFDTKHEYRFIVDRYNILKTGQIFHDVTWLMGCAVYESNLEACQDIPQVYSDWNKYNEVVSNSKSASNINFYCSFDPEKQEKPSSLFFKKDGFSKTYNMSYHQIYTLVFSLPTTIMKDAVFGEIINDQLGLYTIIWKDKQSNILAFQSIHLDHVFKNIKVNLLGDQEKGVTIDQNIMYSSYSKEYREIKVTYKEDNKLGYLDLSIASPIDKLLVIQEVIMKEYPLSELRFEFYEKYQIDPYVKGILFPSGILSKFLQNLVQEDWKNGIYMVPIIQNSKKFTLLNPGFVEVEFYKSDQTILGVAQVPQKINFPIHAYNVKSNSFGEILDVYFSTGMLLKYAP